MSTEPRAPRERVINERTFITRRVMRNYAKLEISRWLKKNKVPASQLKGLTLEAKIEAIGGIR